MKQQILERGVGTVLACFGVFFALASGCGGSDDSSASSSGGTSGPGASSGSSGTSGKGGRFAQEPDSGTQCTTCSTIAGLIVDGMAPAGIGGPGLGSGGTSGAVFDPCSAASDAAQAGPDSFGMGTPNFCKQDVTDAFTQCLQDQCAGPCNFNGLPGGMGAPMCGQAGASSGISAEGPGGAAAAGAGGDGAGGAADGALSSGTTCKDCVVARCAASYVACEADK